MAIKDFDVYEYYFDEEIKRRRIDGNKDKHYLFIDNDSGEQFIVDAKDKLEMSMRLRANGFESFSTDEMDDGVVYQGELDEFTYQTCGLDIF